MFCTVAGQDTMIEGIRQRILAYFYRLMLQNSLDERKVDERKNFYYHFEDFASLAMWKVYVILNL